MATTLILLNQNSDSPYQRTPKKLTRQISTKKIEIQTAGCTVVVQYCMMMAIAASSTCKTSVRDSRTANLLNHELTGVVIAHEYQ